jgi:hypothetical protein
MNAENSAFFLAAALIATLISVLPGAFMPRRYRITPAASNLFSNIAIESGCSDQDNACSGRRPMPHKTFSRIRRQPPASLTADQILHGAFLVQQHTPFGADDYLALARCGRNSGRHGLWTLAVANTQPRDPKSVAHTSRQIQECVAGTSIIDLFDRLDSFAYLRPRTIDEDLTGFSNDPPASTGTSLWCDTAIHWHYDRHPRIRVTLTAGSLSHRLSRYSDNGIEALIGNTESGEHRLTVVRDDVHVAHRVFRDPFGDAAAAAIFNSRRMVVLPVHGRSLRTYDASSDPSHRRIIEQAVRQLRAMRRFRVHDLGQAAVVRYSRGHLSYRLPGWGLS